MTTYSAVELMGSQYTLTGGPGLTLQEASAIAARAHSPNAVSAVINDETDEAVATEVYLAGRKLDPGAVRAIIFGLGRFM